MRSGEEAVTILRRPPIMPSLRISVTTEDEEDGDQIGNDLAVPGVPPNAAEVNSGTGTDSRIVTKNGTGTSFTTSPALWATMGLCWSSNTEYHDKKNFPYREAAPLSIQLWRRIAKARVILQIVYSEESVPSGLGRYKGKNATLETTYKV